MPKTDFTRMFFHATHRDNAQSIMENGLSIEYSTGKRVAVWFTPKKGIMSAIVHAANRHRWPIDEIVVVGVEVKLENVRFSGIPDFYYSSYTERAENFAPATYFLQENEE